MTEYYACAVIYRSTHRSVRLPEDREPEEKIEFLVVDYQSINPQTGERGDVQIKFPGGGIKYPHEYPGMTMAREVFEETGLCVYDWKKGWSVEVSPTHTQHGFLVSADDCLGYMRDWDMDDDDGDSLSSPRWVEAVRLGRFLFPKHLPHYFHAGRHLGLVKPAARPFHPPAK